MSELQIENRSESDLRSCEVEASDFFLGFVCNCPSYFTTAKITFTSLLFDPCGSKILRVRVKFSTFRWKFLIQNISTDTRFQYI